MTKFCSQCKEYKGPSKFYRSKATKDGFMYKCKECAKARNRVWKANNPERVIEHRKNWDNINIDKRRLMNRLWKKENPAKTNSINAARRARKKQAIPKGITCIEISDIELIYRVTRWLSDYEGIQYHVDHIKPLAKGGLHHPSNLQILTAEENIKKGSN